MNKRIIALSVGMVVGGGVIGLAQGVFTVRPTIQWDAVDLKLGKTTEVGGVTVTATKFLEGDIVCFRFFEMPSQSVHYTCTR